MIARQDGLNCRQCFANKEKMPHFQPECQRGRCRTAACQFKEVEVFVSWWQMLRCSESVPVEAFYKHVDLSLEDLEILIMLDSEVAAHREAKRKQKEAQRQAKSGHRNQRTRHTSHN